MPFNGQRIIPRVITGPGIVNIQAYRHLVVRVSHLRQEAFQIITNSQIAIDKMRADGSSYMQMWEKLEEKFKLTTCLSISAL